MKLIYAIVFLVFFSCQKKNDINRIDVFSISEEKITSIQEIKLDSIIFPTEIHSFGQWIVGINLPNYSKNVFDFINKTTLQKDFSCMKFGNGVNEFQECNPYFFKCKDNLIQVNANVFDIKTLRLKNGDLSVLSSKSLSVAPNKIIEIDTEKIAFKPSFEKPNYAIYNIGKQEFVSNFGNFPNVELSEAGEDIDYANFFQETTVFDSEKDQFFSFYSNIPLIRIYKSFKLIKEIWTTDDFNTNITDFYDEKTKIFYGKPLICQGKIYVTYLNKNPEEFSKNSNVNLLIWDMEGELLKRYVIRNPFQTYTISEDGTEFYAIDNSNTDYSTVFKFKL
ncbi:hypothetical protein CKY20_06800 [Capnocytophaga canis]|uniref:Lipoprotein n=1 Tax=Capnocytophaga canis TaxID=1848903 RepID=A0A3A1YGQ7_9FLAO|nr:hypothetical protein [Capnocytophaga canis]RIY36636.1 hypothetical protein CKY20_06800 [Capnocytophaga canis]